jgi:hypothetical protein
MIVHRLAIEVGAIHELPLPRFLETDTKNMTELFNRSSRSPSVSKRESIQSKGYNYSIDRTYFLTDMMAQTSTS